jgi:hypothetical protein
MKETGVGVMVGCRSGGKSEMMFGRRTGKRSKALSEMEKK